MLVVKANLDVPLLGPQICDSDDDSSDIDEFDLNINSLEPESDANEE